MSPAPGRSRSRSPKTSGNFYQDNISVAKAQLAAEVRERIEQWERDGLVQPEELDGPCLSALWSLSRDQQERVLNYVEAEKIFFMAAKSKAGFLIAACQKAKNGSVDVLGIGAVDPWREYLLSIAVAKRATIDLVPEDAWLLHYGTEPVRLGVDVACDPDAVAQFVTLMLPLTSSTLSIKLRLAAMGVKIPVNKMGIRAPVVGFLKDTKSLAFYNIAPCTQLELARKTRGGAARTRDATINFMASSA